MEGINNKLRVIARRAYGFRSHGALISMPVPVLRRHRTGAASTHCYLRRLEKGGFEERFAALEAAVGADVDAFLRRRSVNAQDFETRLQTVHRRALAAASQVVKVVGGQRS